jgi:hypothetical protein
VETSESALSGEEEDSSSEEEGFRPPANREDARLVPTYDDLSGEFTNFKLCYDYQKERMTLWRDFSPADENKGDEAESEAAPWLDCFTSHYLHDENMTPLLELTTGTDGEGKTPLNPLQDKNPRHTKDQIAEAWPKSVPRLRAFYDTIGAQNLRSFPFQTNLHIKPTQFSVGSMHIRGMPIAKSHPASVAPGSKSINVDDIAALTKFSLPPGHLHGMSMCVSSPNHNRRTNT